MWYAVLLGALVLFFFMDWLSLHLRGDCDLKLNTQQLTNAYQERRGPGVVLSFDLLLENQSLKEQALVIYASVQLVPQSKTSKLERTWAKITFANSPREDGYFEAALVKPGKSIPLHVEMLFEDEKDFAKTSGELRLEVSISYYGRKPMRSEHVRFSVPSQMFGQRKTKSAESLKPPQPRTPAKPYVFPIPTHLIFPGEDLGELILKVADKKFKPGDWVAIAESMVAIAQGRVYSVDSIKPGFWAKRLNRLFQFDSSLASCYSLECAIREVGLARILAGAVIGVLGRLLGRSGDFYRIAGRGAATIDDCTGTLPPFDKSVVLGPKNANRIAEEICYKTGFEVAIVDANDLQKVDILGKSCGIVDQELIDALRDNPQGNADEQTPIVMIQRREAG